MSPAFEPLERVRKTDCPEFFSETAGLLSQGKQCCGSGLESAWIHIDFVLNPDLGYQK
jgi:hypothetical protein